MKLDTRLALLQLSAQTVDLRFNMTDYLDNAVEASWTVPSPTPEFDSWDTWTWDFITPPF